MRRGGMVAAAPIPATVVKGAFAGLLFPLADVAPAPPVAQLLHLLLARLAAVLEPDRVAFDARVPVLQRGDPEAAVFLRIDLASRAHEAGGKDAKDARHHLLAREPRQPHPPIDGLAHLRQRAAERDQPVELL